MKSLFTTALFLFTSLVFAQKDIPVVSMTPEKAKVGDEITLLYHSDAPSAQFKNSSSIIAQVLIYRQKDSPLYTETELKKDGPVWKGSLTVKEPGANFLVFKFKEGDKSDDNGGNVWDLLLYASDGKAIKGAHLNRSNIYQYGGFSDFTHLKDMDVAKSEAQIEKELYPDNLDASFALWGIWMKGEDKDGAKASIRKELDDAYPSHKSDDASIGGFIFWYNTVGDTVTAKKIHDEVLAANPKGELAQSDRLNAIYAETDPDKRIALLDIFQKDFPDYKQRNLEGLRAAIVRSYISAKQYDKGADYLEKSNFPAPNTSNTLSLKYLGMDGQLDKAIYWAKRAISFTDKPDPSRKPSYQSDKDYNEDNKSTRSTMLDTYSKCLLKKGDHDGAIKALEEAYMLTKGEDIDINTDYVAALVKAGKNDKACEIGLACLKAGKTGDDLNASFKTAYSNQKGSDKGFDVLIADARKQVLEKMRKDILATRLKDTPEIDFTLNDLNGTPVTLSALKGKVVIVDFWATWCGPCKSSFPHLQKVYDKYKDNKNVQFLALNTWESAFKEYNAKLENAKNFIAENKYTFPVLIDEGAVIDKYGVDGIPTQFIIDKKGNISFKTVGYEGAQMEDTLILQLEILLDESIGMR